MNWLQKLDRKFFGWRVPHLMVILSAACWGNLFDLLLPLKNQSDLPSVPGQEENFQGEVWRWATFIFLPLPPLSVWIVFALYFNCLIPVRGWKTK